MSNKKLMIIGASGHGKVVADIAKQCGYTKISFLDDNQNLKECLEYPVVGTTSCYNIYTDNDFFVAIGNGKIRERVYNELLNNKLRVVTLIHPNATIASHVSIGIGTGVMAGTIINPSCEIGVGCIVNTGSTIDHDNKIGNFSHISIGSHLAGNVTIGKQTWVCAGAVIKNNISVCENCIIGAGAVVVKDIEKSGTFIGVPAKRIK